MCCVKALPLVSAGDGHQRAIQFPDIGVHFRVSHIGPPRVIHVGIAHEVS